MGTGRYWVIRIEACARIDQCVTGHLTHRSITIFKSSDLCQCNIADTRSTRWKNTKQIWDTLKLNRATWSK